MYKHVFICISILLCCSIVICKETPVKNHQSEKEKIQKVVYDSIGWASNKDKELLFNSIAQDADFFIFHPDSQSTIIGFDAFKKMVEEFFMNDAFKAKSFSIKDLVIHVSKTVDTAWFSAYLDDFGEWKGKPTAWVDTRWTGVLEKRKNKWVIVQMHFSFASDKIKAENNAVCKQ